MIPCSICSFSGYLEVIVPKNININYKMYFPNEHCL